MKIAFVSQPFHHVGIEAEDSITIWTHRVLQAATSRADGVIIYCRDLPGMPRVERRDVVEYRRVPVRRDEVLARASRLVERLLGHPRPERPFFASVLNYLEYGLRVAWDVRRQSLDVVHIHNFSQFVPLIRAFNPDVTIVLHMHCEWLSQLDARMIEARLQKTDLVVGCSNHVVEKVRERFPQFADRCHVVHNGVDVELFAPPGRGDEERTQSVPRLLFVGRISPEKGVHVLLKAMEEVVKAVPDAQLDVIGGPGGVAAFEYIVLLSDDQAVRDLEVFYEGRLRRSDYWEKVQRDLPPALVPNINFVGHLTHDEVIDYYHRADVLVNPSLSEAFGLSLVEAMASETPVVAARVGGMREVVEDGRTGLLVAPADAEELAAALIRLLKDDALRRSMGEAGVQRVKELYTWDNVADSLWQEYAAVIDRPDTPVHAQSFSSVP